MLENRLIATISDTIEGDMITYNKFILAFAFFLALFLFLPSPSSAFPGQLNYEVATTPYNGVDTESLASCTALSASCQQKNTELKKENATLTAHLSQEKKKGVLIEIIGALLIILIGVFIFLLKKKSSQSKID